MSFIPALPNQTRPLHVERIDPENCQKIKRIAEGWHILAQKKLELVSSKSDAYPRLIASSTIARAIALECHMIQSNPDLARALQKEIYVCKDETDQVQGIAHVTKKVSSLRIDYVMTHPANIRLPVHKTESNRFEGTGRTFCAFLDREAPKQGVESVVLTALPPSKAFYLKFGFIEESSGKLVKILAAKL